MSVTPNEFVLANAPWSVSKADVARECPKKFDFQYIQKIKVPGIRAFEATTGQIVHRALELALSGVPINKSFDLALQGVRESMSTNEVEDVLTYKPAVQGFIGKFNAYKMKHQGAPPVLEQKLAVDLSGNAVPFFGKDSSGNEIAFLRGVIDMSMLFPGKPVALIMDHKTGKYKPIENYRAQFDMYLMLLKAANPSLEEVKIGINYLKVNKIEFVREMEDVRDIAPIRDRLLRFMNDSTRETHKLDWARRGPLCKWCNFYDICPAQTGNPDGGKKEEQSANTGTI